MTPYPELQQIIKDETDNGRGIVRFLFQAMRGEFHNFTPNHQLMAGRVLAIIGVEQGIEFVEANRPPSLPRNTPQRRILDETDAMLTAAERELADYTQKMSRSGRKMIRFFLDAMNGLVKSFRPSLRIAAARELIGCAFPLLAPAPSVPQPASAAAGPTAKSPNGHELRCSCSDCRQQALTEYSQLHCEEGEEIYQSIIRRAMTAEQDSQRRVAETARLWTEVNEFVRKRCPDAETAAFPTWFHNLMEHDDDYPHGYNPELVSDLYYHWYGADFDDEDPDCSCDGCDDHDRDEYGRCLCEICYDIQDDP